MADAEAAHSGQLRGLGVLPELRHTKVLTVTNSVTFDTTFSWGAEGRTQSVRASDLYQNEWWDHVLYKKKGWTSGRHCRACLIIKAIDTEPTAIVVVHELAQAEAKEHCVLTEVPLSAPAKDDRQRDDVSISGRRRHRRRGAAGEYCTRFRGPL